MNISVRQVEKDNGIQAAKKKYAGHYPKFKIE